MPRYAFRCRTCGLGFEVSRPMSEAGRDARCPSDGGASDRVFTAPMTSFRQGDAAPADAAASPSAGSTGRSWSSPFFPNSTPSEGAPRPTATPRHVLPPGSSRPTRFRHFGHWHPAGTPSHAHPARRPPPVKPPPRADV